METKLQVFYSETSNVNIRMEQVNGEPWFVAKDVCDALGLVNSRKATSSLEDDEKGVSLVVTSSGEQSMTMINESGLYNIIFQSRKPEARAFRRWVTNEVLPAIRRTGAFKLLDETEERKKLPLPKYRPFYSEWKERVSPYISREEIGIAAGECGVTSSHVLKVFRGTSVSERVTVTITNLAMDNRRRGVTYPDAVPIHEQLVIEWEGDASHIHTEKRFAVPVISVDDRERPFSSSRSQS